MRPCNARVVWSTLWPTGIHCVRVKCHETKYRVSDDIGVPQSGMPAVSPLKRPPTHPPTKASAAIATTHASICLFIKITRRYKQGPCRRSWSFEFAVSMVVPLGLPFVCLDCASPRTSTVAVRPANKFSSPGLQTSLSFWGFSGVQTLTGRTAAHAARTKNHPFRTPDCSPFTVHYLWCAVGRLREFAPLWYSLTKKKYRETICLAHQCCVVQIIVRCDGVSTIVL